MRGSGFLFAPAYVSVLAFATMVPAAAQVPSDGLVAYYPLSGDAHDAGPAGYDGVNHGAIATADRFGAPGGALRFDGRSAYLEIPDRDGFSIAATGAFTISIWMRPDTLNFAKPESEGYVHWMGKGVPGQHEWVLRMYGRETDRPNRMSCYAYNLAGGLGSGSFVQEEVTPSAWVHLVARYDFPANDIRIYKNGKKTDQDFFTDYAVIPANGTAPVRIGTRDFGSWFQGAVDDARFYSRALSDAEITALYAEKHAGVAVERPRGHAVAFAQRPGRRTVDGKLHRP